MLKVTENAKRHLKRLLMNNTSDPNLGIRLKADKGMQLGILIDQKADEDYVVEHEGVKVLMVGPKLFPLVDGLTLDTERNDSVASLIITKGDHNRLERIGDTSCVNWDKRSE